jgi:hypothetical protein
MSENLGSNDPLEIMKSEPDVKTLLKESLDAFEREIWPIYASRGYDKNIALLSYSLGLVGEVLSDVFDCGCEDEPDAG